MAEELDPILQEFIADMRRYIDPMGEGINEAHDFAHANEEVLLVLRELVTETKANGRAIQDMAAKMGAADAALGTFASEMQDAADATEKEADELKKVADNAGKASAALGLVAGAAAAAGGSTFLATLGKMASMTGLIAGGIAVIGPAFLSIGTSVAAFGALALPTLKSVFGAVSAIATAQQAIQAATTPQQLADAQKQLALAWGGLDKQQTQMVKEIQAFQNAMSSIATQFEGTVAKVLAPALHFAADLFARLGPAATAGANVLILVFTNLDKMVKSTQFMKWMQTMASYAVPMAKALGGIIAPAVGMVMKAMAVLLPISLTFLQIFGRMVQQLANSGALTMFLKVFGVALIDIAKILQPLLPYLWQIVNILGQALLGAFAALMPVIMPLVKDLLPTLRDTIKALAPVMTQLITPNGPLIQAFKDLLPLVALLLHWIDNLAKFMIAHPVFAKLIADTLVFLGIAKILLPILGLVQKGLALIGLAAEADPIILIITAIILLVIWFKHLWDTSKAFRDFWKGMWRDIKQWAVDAWQWVYKAIMGIGQDFVALYNGIIGIPAMIWNVFKGIYNGALTIGKNLIIGLWNGIVSMASKFWNWLFGWAKSILSSLWHAFGLGSPSKHTYEMGTFLVMGLAKGIAASTPLAVTAMRAATTAVIAAARGVAVPTTGVLGPGGGRAGAFPAFATSGVTGPMNLTITMLMPNGQASTQKATLVYNRLNPNNGLTVRVR